MRLNQLIVNTISVVATALFVQWYQDSRFTSVDEECQDLGYGAALVDRDGSFYCLYMKQGDLMVVEYEKGVLTPRIGE